VTPQPQLRWAAGISKNFQFDKFMEAGIKFEKCKILCYSKIESKETKVKNNTPAFYLYIGDSNFITPISNFYLIINGGPHDTRGTIRQARTNSHPR
jgi:hypothetical protein